MQRMKDFLEALDQQPGLDYLMIRLTVFILTGIGIVMVMSSSMTWSVIEGSSVWGGATRQAVMVAAGLVIFWAMLKIPPVRLAKVALPVFGVAVLLLIAVLIPGVGTGRDEVGSQSWIVLGPLRLQPSEAAKIAVAIFGAWLLAGRSTKGRGLRDPFVVFTGVGLALTVLIIAEGDLGMAVAFALVVGFVLLFSGVGKRWLLSLIGVGAVGMAWVFISGGFRSERFHVYFDALVGNFTDTGDKAYQSYQGFLSLADGSLMGVGLGQSRAKWFYLPEAGNDFIFAIIGEELGLWGGVLVIVLFGVLGFFGLRTSLRAADRFQAILAATLTASVVCQAFINIGYVIGILPVTGIQLPLISAGGTSAITTLAAMGILANIARHEPANVSAVQSYGRPVFDRILLIGEPKGAPVEAQRSRKPASQRPRPLTASVRTGRYQSAPREEHRPGYGRRESTWASGPSARTHSTRRRNK